MSKLGIKYFFPKLVVLNQNGLLGIFPWWWGGISLFIIGLWFLRERTYNWELCLILAGGVSNLLDRFLWGGVVDFPIFGFLPAFNLADLMIDLGIILILFKGFSKNL
ncbi:hypothetical protein A2160_05885 [Candidatus Beckwithbacteria bacterium RBG_13_42_9]|uniref:Uncharacterized protein n=1 Tax=Candidatus Beckwithbacteria bacterium RBG_13_42_9 TaxID=1797457 RepID=A0A1F5E5B6_9BACT|nr:MAG: hypothetical protein A2160_05885 [Candidatus Beckwithbacteria bacterium RBG_13_42_9]